MLAQYLPQPLDEYRPNDADGNPKPHQSLRWATVEGKRLKNYSLIARHLCDRWQGAAPERHAASVGDSGGVAEGSGGNVSAMYWRGLSWCIAILVFTPSGALPCAALALRLGPPGRGRPETSGGGVLSLCRRNKVRKLFCASKASVSISTALKFTVS